ncbi:DUF4231 domain-containing protein [Brasilonema sp. UFV-L1]|uniref:DUF4231 domain-containing protein n=1 Tax=Brasilonema sp. UFV-L1 TaxID=2234130 RepID=UPI00145EEB13|nr:DUF4231 domain-containing protein [Brasilonema sp. UFV-L1]NMG09988.1 DUF4231 domain-containing protein [Brasilonema sp. UFV-L1]
MTTFEKTNQNEIPNSSTPNPNMLFALKTIEYLSLGALICSVVITKILPEIQIVKIYVAAFLSSWIFLFLVNRQLFKEYGRASIQSNISKKAELHTYLLPNKSLDNNLITPARINAIEYCQELIDDYKKTRNNSRNIYYFSQIGTIVFSGVTPILVLVDKLEAGVSWLKWLPVICPAIASIVASIVTSFPFQETWVAANTTVELLEAEQEKFILGVSELYRSYDLADETQRQQKAQIAVENFVTQVNNIHLKQIQELNTKSVQKSAQAKTESSQSPESNQSN